MGCGASVRSEWRPRLESEPPPLAATSNSPVPGG
jgi:hypothetical protein